MQKIHIPLVLIDVQDAFLDDMGPAAKPVYTERVVRTVHRARAHNQRIVLVEYSGHGQTARPILTALDNYARTVRVKKRNDGGGREVVKALTDTHGPCSVIEVAGVNTSYCVASTVTEMAQLLKDTQIRVVRSITRNAWAPQVGPHKLPRTPANVCVYGRDYLLPGYTKRTST